MMYHAKSIEQTVQIQSRAINALMHHTDTHTHGLKWTYTC